MSTLPQRALSCNTVQPPCAAPRLSKMSTKDARKHLARSGHVHLGVLGKRLNHGKVTGANRNDQGRALSLRRQSVGV